MATKKPKAAKKKSGAKSKAKKVAKPAKSAKSAARSARAPSHPFAAELAKHFGVSEREVIERGLRELAARAGLHGASEPKHVDAHQDAAEPAPIAAIEQPAQRLASSATSMKPGSYLPRRLYLALDSRGLDGAGMPVEIIDARCTIGSGRRNTIWINSPQVETVHAQIVQTDEGWVFEDAGSTHGTFLNEERITRRVIHDGDTFLLAGYLRVRAELR